MLNTLLTKYKVIKINLPILGVKFGFIYFHAGQSCGTYDEDFMSMKWVDDESCFTCPWSYNSTEQFKCRFTIARSIFKI